MTFEVGKTYVFFTPPGWILGGTVTKVENDGLVLADAVHLESVASGHAVMADLPMASTAAAQRKIVGRANGLVDGYMVRASAILHAAECRISLRALSRAADAAAIKGAG